MVPHLPPTAGWPVAPAPGPPSLPAHPSLLHAQPGLLAAPGARRGLAGRWWSVWRGGGGWSVRRPSSGARPGGPAGRGARRSLCCGSSLRPPWAGTKAGCFVIAPPCTMHWLTSACCCPIAAYGVPLRAHAELPVCCGHCRSGWAADWRHATYSSACRGSGAPPWVSRPSRRGGGLPPDPAGGGAGLPSPWPGSGRPRVGGGEGGGGLPAVSPWSPGAAPRWLLGGSLVFPASGGQPLTGGVHSSPAPRHPPGARLSCGPSPRAPLLPSLPSPRCVVPPGGGGGSAVARGGGRGQWLAISGLRGSGVSAPRVSSRSLPLPSPLPGAARALPLRHRRGLGGGALGRRAQSCRAGVPR